VVSAGTSHKKNILAVDDEPKILEVISSFLKSRGYGVVCAADGREALRVLERENIALVILDLMLPGIRGEEVCARIRASSRVPIIMLTAKTEEADMLTGLRIGADDYMTKPFSLKELAARVEAVLRRTRDDLVPLLAKNSFNGGDLVTDFEKNEVRKKGNPVGLTPSELKILSALIRRPGRVYSREELIGIALGGEFDGFDRIIDSHIKNLRRKIEDRPRRPVYVLTVHGMGYKFGGAP
jgi:DNA-binding response OmpR family regulator